jgi:hypothetical protein
MLTEKHVKSDESIIKYWRNYEGWNIGIGVAKGRVAREVCNL